MVKRKMETLSRQWYQKFRWFISSEGFLVVAGKDAVSNEVLVKKHASPEDPVFHADITGAPFVVIKSEGKQPSEHTLQQAAQFAVSYSRAWRENMGAADAYWVTPDQLSKSGPSGEYVAHGAFAVAGKRNWIRNVSLKLAVGVVITDTVKFIGGPVEAVAKKTNTFILIVPGDLTGKEILQQVLRALTAKLSKEMREKAGKTSIEQIREFIPFTKGRLLSV
jgi:hypothetical protein